MRHAWKWLEHIHTAIWLISVGGGGLGAVILAAVTLYYSGHVEWIAIIVTFLGSFLLLMVGLALKHRVVLRILDKKLDPDRRDAVTYKSKLRVVLQNETKQILYFYGARWIKGNSGVAFQRKFWFRFEVESATGYHSNNPWQTEDTEAYVEPGKVFRASIGLDSSVLDEELRRRQADKRLGTLVLFMQIAGLDDEWEIKL